MSDLTEIGRDLLVMEISTVASDVITGRKMPWFPHALIDILSKYSDWFVKLRSLEIGRVLALREPLTEETLVNLTLRRAPDSDAGITNGWRTIEQLRRTAKIIARDEFMGTINKDPLNELEKGIALRIRRNCDQLKSMVVRFRAIDEWEPYLLSVAGRANNEQARLDTGADPNWTEFRQVDDGLTRTEISKALEGLESAGRRAAVLDTEVATRLRKIWELGTDRVVAQTVVHIDGDTITRFQSDLPEHERTYYLNVHNQSVRIAVEQWRTLFDAFTKLLDGVADRIFGRVT